MIENTRHWFFQDAELSEKPFKTRTFKEKLRVIRFYAIIGVLGGFLILVARYVSNRVSERQAMKKKLKHFKPTIHEGVFLTTMSWQERDTPLTDEELKNRY
jgi:hypothetical protein